MTLITVSALCFAATVVAAALLTHIHARVTTRRRATVLDHELFRRFTHQVQQPHLQARHPVDQWADGLDWEDR